MTDRSIATRRSAGSVLWAWAPALVLMAAIFVVSHQPSVTIPFDAPDYYAHGLSYSVLGFLLVRALAGGDLKRMTWGLVLLATVIGGLYGVSDEFHQSFIPGRHPSVSDVIADTVGSLAGAAAGAALGGWLRRSDRTQGSRYA